MVKISGVKNSTTYKHVEYPTITKWNWGRSVTTNNKK